MVEIQSRFTVVEREAIFENARKCLWTDEGKVGLDYLRNVRKLSDDVIRAFSLGYYPDFVNHQLAGRIIMPLFDPSGNLVIISSRKIVETGVAGQIQLPHHWHEQYEKSFHLFGIHLAKEAMQKWRFVIIVEGQFDAIQLHNWGFTNAVAVCGHNLTQMQIATIWRYCDEMVIMFDCDPNQTGQKGTMKVMDLAWNSPEGGTYSRLGAYKLAAVQLPPDTDPDEFLRERGRAGLELLTEQLKGRVQELRRRYV